MEESIAKTVGILAAFWVAIFGIAFLTRRRGDHDRHYESRSSSRYEISPSPPVRSSRWDDYYSMRSVTPISSRDSFVPVRRRDLRRLEQIEAGPEPEVKPRYSGWNMRRRRSEDKMRHDDEPERSTSRHNRRDSWLSPALRIIRYNRGSSRRELKDDNRK